MNRWLLKNLFLTIGMLVLMVASLVYFLVAEIDRTSAERTLRDSSAMLSTMRTVYRHRIMVADLPLTETTLRLCPGSAIGEMANTIRTAGGGKEVSFGNVSDHPRNEHNRADSYALSAITYFRQNPEKEFQFSTHHGQDGKDFYQYALPLRIEKDCLRCHGPREKTPELVRQLYTEGFDYAEGDLRGVLYVRLVSGKGQFIYITIAAILAWLLVVGGIFLILTRKFQHRFGLRFEALNHASRLALSGSSCPVPTDDYNDELSAVVRGYNQMVHAVQERELQLEASALKAEYDAHFLASVTNCVENGIVVLDDECNVQLINEAAIRMLKLPQADYLGAKCNEIIHSVGTGSHGLLGGIHAYVLNGLQNGFCQYKILHTVENVGDDNPAGSGTSLPRHTYEFSMSPLKRGDNSVLGGILTIHDVSERIAYEEELKENGEKMFALANLDPLTGLCNRRAFESRLFDAMGSTDDTGEALALLLLDLDGFKNVNDTMGHPVGDALLCMVAERLRECIPTTENIYRLSGDEYVVLLSQVTPDVADYLATCIVTTVSRPYHIAGHKVHLSASLGVALYPEDADSGPELIKSADIAMYRAKKAGGSMACRFSKAQFNELSHRFSLLGDLREAIANREFYLVYQPQHDVSTQGIRGAEALIRWRSPKRGIVGPNDFIPLLEESGMITQLTEWLLDTALVQQGQWTAAGLPGMVISINMAAAQFLDGDFAGLVERKLAQFGIPPAMLEIEITERMILGDMDQATQAIRALRQLGVKVALDDFGTGYSSLSYLATLSLDTLKIDKSFVQTLPESEKARQIFWFIASLGRGLDMEIVAEGVETTDELAIATAAGCNFIQGYLFGKPQSPEDILATYRPAPNTEQITLENPA